MEDSLEGERFDVMSVRRWRERALGEGPNTVDGLLPMVYWDVKEPMYPYAARSLLAGLQMLQETGEAHETGGVWQATEPPPGSRG